MFVSVDFGPDGVTLLRRVVNNGDGTGSITVYAPDGSVEFVEELTGLDYVPPFEPLDATGALATLLVVEGVLPLQDAANALHEEPAHLEHEALSWQVAGG